MEESQATSLNIESDGTALNMCAIPQIQTWRVT